MGFPRVMISALRGGSGKTLLSIGLIAAWKRSGIEIAPFKKGPDYIDAGWLAKAAGRPCHNLDTYLMDAEDIRRSFIQHTQDSQIAVIEGNRGLYDGIDVEGHTSTAELAKLLSFPVLICIDATKTTRTVAAVVSGCGNFDPTVQIRGVVLNRVAGARHERILRQSIEHFCDIPVVGAIPKLGRENFPERHMGLVPTPEHSETEASISAAADVAEKYLDLATIEALARKTEKLQMSPFQSLYPDETLPKSQAVIGIVRDSAFQFYYPENIEALRQTGARLVFISPLEPKALPEMDGLFIGGGFPETHAEQLSDNRPFRESLKAQIESGLPVYAECGGLMYLGQDLVIGNSVYPMAGVLPIRYGLSKKPQGHGYTHLTVDRKNPYFQKETEIRGHEFHYSTVLDWNGTDSDLVFRMNRGKGIIDHRDGAVYKNVLATYTHIHALGTPGWAPAMVRAALAYKRSRL